MHRFPQTRLPQTFRVQIAVLTCLTCLAGAVPGLAQQFVEESASRFPTPAPSEWTNQITIGDIDDDGDLDLLFANGGSFSSPGTLEVQRVYVNNGTGVFTDESASRLGFSGLCRGVELGDIDRDGDLDLIFAQDFNRLPALFVNNGSGFFTNVTATQLPAITLSSSRAQFGDIDNDGDLDLYLTNGGSSNRFGCGQYRVYVNDGSGHFSDETATRHPIANVCENMDCIFGDIDNDFDLDVKTASTGTNNSRLYRNDGSGVFSLDNTVPADSTCYSYDFGDIDRDGDLDLLGANGLPGSSSDILLVNNGSGGYTEMSSRISPNPNQDDNDSKFFDYDDDGDLDLIIARLGSGGEKLYNNDGTGNFTQTSGVIQVLSDSSLDIKVGDLDGDGDFDLVTGQGESGSFVNRLYINHGPAADTRDPRIVATEQVPAPTDSAGPYVVRSLILDDMTSDRGFFDTGVFLHYTVDSAPEQHVVMHHSGGQVYRGEIPGQPAGSTVEYYVTALDFANNLGVGDPQSFVVGGLIFADGFEAGNLSAWSAVVPLTVSRVSIDPRGQR